MTDVETQFYTRTRDAWDIMLQDIDHAQKTIDIEQYIFTIDVIGERFLELLQEKARQGIQIRLMLDMVGSLGFYRSPMPELLRKNGIQVRFFNPISLWRIATLTFTSNFFRDHRKIMVIDGKIGHIGGVGIQDDMVNWRDTHVRTTGLLVQDIASSFETVWKQKGKNMMGSFKRTKQFVKNFNLLTNSPRPRQRYLYQALILNIRNAKKYIYLTTPYFIPDIRLFRVLRLAAKRGVDVQLLVPEVADHIFINHARESYFTLALKAGIRIYVYKGLMMHAKTGVIDDEWATAGSFNLDNLSLSFNYEANISTSDKQFIQDVKTHFLEDVQSSREIILETWIRRPLGKKILELLTWPFHGIM
ncbi:hypothetical protein KW782_01235 [Candidatus Parcubacteria bacterium]|nr:hypothetical protein [Candidatus Parcubacteria bacterium]